MPHWAPCARHARARSLQLGRAIASCDHWSHRQPAHDRDLATHDRTATPSVTLDRFRVRRVGQPRPPLARPPQPARTGFRRQCSHARSLRFTRPRSSSASSSARRSSCSRPSSPARCRRSAASIRSGSSSGILTLFGALIAAELASAYPHAGGVYVFLREAFSPAVGFLWGWAMFWTMHTGIIAVIAMVFARYVAFFLPVGDAGMRAARRRRRRRAHGGELRRRAAGKPRPDDAHDRQGRRGRRDHRARVRARPAHAARIGPADAASPIGRAAAIHVLAVRCSRVVAGLFAFGGWHMVTYAAEETRDPERTIPRALRRRRADRHRLLHRAERGVLPRAAPRPDRRRRRASPPTPPTPCSVTAARR